MDCTVTMTWSEDWQGEVLPPPPATATFKVTLGGYADNVFIGGPEVETELDMSSLVRSESIAHFKPVGGTTLADGQHQEQDTLFVRVNDSSNELRMGYRSFLIQQATNGQNTVTWTAPHLKTLVRVKQGTMTQQSYSPNALAVLSFAADNDDRSVTINSANIDPSYSRSMDTSHPLAKYRNQAPPQPFQAPLIGEVAAGLLNERNPNGSMTADSVAVWDGPSDQWMAQGIYQANTINFSGGSRSWSLSGGDATGTAQDELASSQTTINLTPYSGLYYDLNGVMLGGNAGGIGMMGQTTITLSATDTDGAQGENTYLVNWHLPYEKLRDLPNGSKTKEIYWVSKHYMNGNTQFQLETCEAKSFDALAAIDDVLVLGGALGAPTEPISELVSVYRALTNISEWVHDEPEFEVTSTTALNGTDAFSAALRHWPENIQGMNVDLRNSLMQSQNYDSFSDYDVYVGRVRYHHEESVLADKYDIHGFDSSNHVFRHDVTERAEFQNYYRLRGPAPTNPPTPGDAEVPPSYNLS